MMMDRPLLISSIIDHAALSHGDTEIVSRTIELENVAVGHPEVAEACVIGVSHPKRRRLLRSAETQSTHATCAR